MSFFLSFLALKLLATERYAHVADYAFDPGLGLFAGLNVLPKCTAMSTYSYSLDEVHIVRLQQAFIKQASKLGLYHGCIIGLDFHTAPHYGHESVLEKYGGPWEEHEWSPHLVRSRRHDKADPVRDN